MPVGSSLGLVFPTEVFRSFLIVVSSVDSHFSLGAVPSFLIVLYSGVHRLLCRVWCLAPVESSTGPLDTCEWGFYLFHISTGWWGVLVAFALWLYYLLWGFYKLFDAFRSSTKSAFSSFVPSVSWVFLDFLIILVCALDCSQLFVYITTIYLFPWFCWCLQEFFDTCQVFRGLWFYLRCFQQPPDDAC